MNLGGGTKNKRIEQMEELIKVVKKRSKLFCDGQKQQNKEKTSTDMRIQMLQIFKHK